MEPLGVVVTVLGSLVALLYPAAALATLLFIAPTIDTAIPLGVMYAHPSNVVTLACALSGLRVWLVVDGRFGLTRTDVAGIAALAWLGFRLVISDFDANAVRRVSAILVMGAGYLAGRTLVRTEAALRSFRDWMAGSGFLAAATAGIVLLPGVGGRDVGNFGNPNALGLYLACCLPFAVSAALLPTRPGLRIPFGLLTLAVIYGLIASGSRGALVGALAGLSLMMTRQLRRALMVAAVGASAFVLLAFFETGRSDLARIPYALEMAPQVLEASKVWLARNGFIEASFASPPWIEPDAIERFPRTMGARMMIWYQAVLVVSERPLLGLGPGESLFSGVPFDSKTFASCFNIYLATLVEGGLPGLLLHLAWISAIASALASAYLQNRVPRDLVDPVAGALLAAACHGLTEDTYFAIYVNWVIGILAGVAAGLAGPAPGRLPADRPLVRIPSIASTSRTGSST